MVLSGNVNMTAIQLSTESKVTGFQNTGDLKGL